VVVLARELTLEQVKAIHEAIVSEGITGPSGALVRIEMFAHGAFCMAVSGKCYLSLDAYGASANRGACLQVCRRGYLLTDYETGNEIHVDNKYLMSPKDLCTIDFLDKFVEAGVKVFKIEGRARSADYVKITAQCYREAADAVADGSYTPELGTRLKERLATVFNRGFWDGYYQGAYLGQWSEVYGSHATKMKIYCGKVSNWFDRINVAEITVETRPLHKGDEVLVIGATTGCVQFTVEDMRLEFEPVEEAPKGARCSLSVPDGMKLRRGDKLYIWADSGRGGC
jgi:putative protease